MPRYILILICVLLLKVKSLGISANLNPNSTPVYRRQYTTLYDHTESHQEIP